MPGPKIANKKYPWNEMEVGDSIFAEGRTQDSVAAAVGGWARYHANGWKFATRKVEGGVRVWRIA